VWRIWSNAFSAAVIIGTVSIRTVNADLEPSPLEKLEHACILFQSAAESSSRALRALPILLTMREKTLQSRQSNTDDAKPGYPRIEPYDELAIFIGRMGLVLPKRPVNARTSVTLPSAIRLPSIPNLLRPHEETSPSLSHYPHRSAAQPGYVGSDSISTSTAFPLNWESLHREIPESTYYGSGTTHSDTTVSPVNPPGDAMLEDRWSSFMHHYAMMGDVQTRSRY